MSSTPTELPTGWASCALGELGSWKGGGTPSKSNTAFWRNGTVPWVSAKDMKFSHITKAEDYITEEAVENSATNLIDPGAVLMVTRSGILRHTFPVAVNEVRVAINQDLKALQPLPELDPNYIALFLLSQNDDILHACAKDGTTVQSIELSALQSIRVPIAPAKEQLRIVSKIDELFSRIEAGEDALKRAQVLVDRYRKSVLKAAVTGELTRDWREKNRDKIEPADKLLERILKARRAAWEAAELAKMKAKGNPPKDDGWKKRYTEPSPPETSELPELPEGWTWASLPQLGDFGRGKSKHRPRNDPKLFNGAYPFIQTGEVRNSSGTIQSFDTTYNDRGLAQSRLWPIGTVCITIAANIAATGILDFAACFPDSVVGLVPANGISGRYIEYFMRTARDDLDRYAPATAQKNINLDILEKVAVPLPPTEELDVLMAALTRALNQVDALQESLDAQIVSSMALRQATLKAAFQGKLVPQDKSEEPASALLDRIRQGVSLTVRPPRKRKTA